MQQPTMYAADKVAPVPEVVAIERELSEVASQLANATDAFLEARRIHNEMSDRFAMTLAKLEGARQEAGA